MRTGHRSIDTAIQSVPLGASDTWASPAHPTNSRFASAGRSRGNPWNGAPTPGTGTHAPRPGPVLHRRRPAVPRDAPVDRTGGADRLQCSHDGGNRLRQGDGGEVEPCPQPPAGRPFVVVECAALQADLLQSELFGHERGAFTGAKRNKPGLFEVAHGGAMFLDEVGEISQTTRVKLLRVLDTSTFRPVGGTSETRVDVRVLAATNRDMLQRVRQGLFRPDLFYRSRTITIALPPLRQRGSDIDLLARHFVSVINGRHGLRKQIGPGRSGS